MIRILNNYACLGGNRYKWNEVRNDIQVVAVEKDPELARLYKERFPNDEVVIEDAHQYLLDHYKEFDFIWTSPPCPSHSRARYWRHGANGKDPVYPDLRLYEEIIFLKYHFRGKYVVENVIPYYEEDLPGATLIPPKKRNRHLYWTNFHLPSVLSEREIQICQGKDEIKRLSEFHDFDFNKYKGEQRLNKIARNLVDYEAGRRIFETAMNIERSNNSKQTDIFTAI